MTKSEFLIKYNIAAELADTAFNKLGLAAKRFTKTYKLEYSDLADEEHFVKKDFAIVEGEGVNRKAKTERLQNGVEILVMDDSKEKELRAALKAWKQEEISFELNKHTPIELTGKLLLISPIIYEELNGYVFNVDEETYINAFEADLEKQLEN